MSKFFEDIERDFRTFHNRLSKDVYSAFDNVLPGTRNFGSVDMAEKESNILVRVDVPGVSEKNVSVLAGANDLSISAYRPCFSDELQNENKPNTFAMWQRNRFCGHFKSSFTLPCEVNPKSVSAEVSDGVLYVTADKLTGENSAHQVAVQRKM